MPNHHIPFEEYNLKVLTECEAFPDESVRIGINSFGFGGANGHCIVEEYRPKEKITYSTPLIRKSNPFTLIPISAKNYSALMGLCNDLAEALENFDADLYTLAANLSLGRTAFQCRKTFVVQSIPELQKQLRDFVENQGNSKIAHDQAPKILMVFPGQGSQWAGCGKDLYENNLVFANVIDRFDDYWASLSGRSLKEAMFNASQEALNECELAQPVTCLLQVALFETLKTWGVYPDCVLGHSAGECAAAYASGALSMEQLCRLVYHRSRLQQTTAGCGRMLVVGLNKTNTMKLLEKYQSLEIACENSESNTVVCGAFDSLQELSVILEKENIFHKFVNGIIAFHSKNMEPIKHELLNELAFLNNVNFDFDMPMISSVTADVVKSLDANYWWSNTRKTVKYWDAILFAKESIKPDLILEVSPHITLRSATQETLLSQEYLTTLIRNENNSECFHKALGGLFEAGVKLDFKSQYPRAKPICHLLPRHPMQLELTQNNLCDNEHFLKRHPYSHGPLIGRKVEDDNYFFETFISSQHYYWMSDHIVQNMAIVPAAAYVEMILEALKESEHICISEIEFKNPCPVTSSVRHLFVKLFEDPKSVERYTFQISSREYQADSKYIVHCLGTVIIGNPAQHQMNASTLPIDTIQKYTDRVYESGDAFYNQMEAMIGDSYNYGPYFQVISEIHEDPSSKKLLMKLDMNENMWSGGQELGYRLHPILFDGALQSLIIWLMRVPDVFAIPKRIHNFTFWKRPSSSRLICLYDPPSFWKNKHRKGQAFLGGGESDSGRLTLYDPCDGSLVASIEAYICFLTNKERSNVDNAKYETIWQRKSIDYFQCGQTLPSLRNYKNKNQLILQTIVGSMTKTHFVRILEYYECDGEDKVDLYPIKTIANQNVEYHLLSNSEEFIDEVVTNQHKLGNQLRCETINLKELSSEGLMYNTLRCNFADLAVVHLKTQVKLQLEKLALLLAPGAPVLVLGKTTEKLPEGYECIEKSRGRMLLRAPLNFSRITAIQSKQHRIIIHDTQGLSRQKHSFEGQSITNVERDYIFEKPENLDDFLSSIVDLTAIDFWCGVDVDNDFSQQAVNKLLLLIQGLIRQVQTEKRQTQIQLWIITRGAMHYVTNPHASAIWGAARTAQIEASESGKLNITLVDIGDNIEADLKFLKTLRDIPLREQEYVIRDGNLWVNRLRHVTPAQIVVKESPQQNLAYRLTVNEPGQLSSLGFVSYVLPPLGARDVEVEVKASALNFRDVMVALERLPLLSYEHSALGKQIGIEAAGIVRKTGKSVKHLKPGDRVVLMVGGSIANILRAPASTVIPFKGNFSFSEAASSFSVYTTVYYALVHIARMKKNQSLLVHSGMGGIGQAAINLAKYLGVKVYATAGSPEKRDALLKMRVVAAFDSHSYDWAEQVTQLRKGKGVDVVLNSLAGEHVRLGLEVLSPGGWFCELGKMDIFADHPLHLQVFRKNIGFRAIDVDRLMKDDPDLCAEMGSKCLALIESGKLPILPITEYSCNEYQQAFRSMVNAKHVGKLVLKRSEEDPVVNIKDDSPLFSPKETILFTGCFGDFGSCVLSYAASMGVKNMLLLDRDPKQKRDQEWIKCRSNIGVLFPDLRIEIIQGDVADLDDVRRAFKAVKLLKMPELSGVFHLAGLLDDKQITEQSLASYQKILAPKARGAWNLHLASLEYNSQLKYFVMISSVVSVFGNPGQFNYAAANAFLDGLAKYRQSQGLPGLSYNMGAIADKGMAARDPQVLRLMKARGIPAISSYFAIEILDHALRNPEKANHIISLMVNRWRVSGKHPDYLRTGMLTSTSDMNPKSTEKKLSLGFVTEKLIEKLSELTGHNNVQSDEGISSYGLNSITVAEFGVFLEVHFNYSASTLALLSNLTCKSLAESIVASASENKENAGISDSEKLTRPSETKKSIFQEKIYRRPSEFKLPLEKHFEDGKIPENFAEHYLSDPQETEAQAIARGINFDLEALIESYTDHSTRLPSACERDLQSIKRHIDIKISQSNLLNASKPDEVRHALITGATGFVGRVLLQSLLEHKPDIQLHCIVRADDSSHAKQRIRDAMKYAGVWKDQYNDKIVAYAGNIEKEKFGLPPEVFGFLSQTIDSVYHLAASLNLNAPYSEMRQTNTSSIIHILDLCTTTKLKAIHFSSTLGIFPEYFSSFSNEFSNGTILENTHPSISKMKQLFPLTIFGYPWSKLIVELGLLHAHQKGVPVGIYRLPITGVCMATGYTQSTDIKTRLATAALQTQSKPSGFDFSWTEPADILCDLVSKISLSPTRKHVIYNCCNPKIDYADRLDISGFGLKLEEVSYKEFRRRCLKFGVQSPLNNYWTLVDYFSNYWFTYSKRASTPRISVDNFHEDLEGIPEWPEYTKVLSNALQWMEATPSWPYPLPKFNFKHKSR